MDKMTGKSLDLVAENIKTLKTLFPEAVTEGKIDFEVLKALLGEEIESRQEHYKFTWNGKEQARAYARTSSMGTLRPCPEESSGRDGTPGKFDSDNLYIEGDNLEVLKLLQGSYHKKVKMIYIDPPYNTGKDFVYPDNFRDSIANYKSLTGQTDDEGKATRANPETSGRYHTDWLNMMFPRLILARNLLTDDGVIFVSIDDTEVDNLKKLCNEVFGEENFVAQIIWKKRSTPPNDKVIGSQHDYIICYAKSLTQVKLYYRERTSEQIARYSNPDNHPKGPWMSGDLMANIKGGRYVASLYFPIINPRTKQEHYPSSNGNWRFNKETIERLIQNDEIYFGEDDHGRPKLKRFLCDVKEGVTWTTLWDFLPFNTAASQEMASLFGNMSTFENPKPSGLIIEILKLATTEDSLVLDFFSGSATTAHAVMQLNADDGGHRKFIMVQLPEACDEGTEAAKAGYRNICEIGKERIRRAARKIKDVNPLFMGDMGFRVFKLDTSNYIPWHPESGNIELLLRNAVDNILTDRTRQDLLYEILLKNNLPLTLPIEERKFGENTVYTVGGYWPSAWIFTFRSLSPTTSSSCVTSWRPSFRCRSSSVTTASRMSSRPTSCRY